MPLAARRTIWLYRDSHRTFEDYCRDRWGFKRIYAHYLIEGAKVVEGLSVHHGEHLPATERQARPLTKLKEPELLPPLIRPQRRQPIHDRSARPWQQPLHLFLIPLFPPLHILHLPLQ